MWLPAGYSAGAVRYRDPDQYPDISRFPLGISHDEEHAEKRIKGYDLLDTPQIDTAVHVDVVSRFNLEVEVFLIDIN